MELQVLDYEVWGNQEDGWDVNDVFKGSLIVDLPEDFTNEQLLNALIEIGYFSDKANMETVAFQDLSEFSVEFLEADTGMPLGRVEPIIARY